MDEKTSKNIKKFVCNICNFKCCKKGDYTRHTITTKHRLLINPIDINVKLPDEILECDCGKKYKHKPSLIFHKKTCEYKTIDVFKQETQEMNKMVNSPDKDLILELLAQNKELMNLLTSQQQEHKEETRELVVTIKEQSNTIKDIIPKIGSNNNNTTNNNNKFNLQVFLNEDCKDAINFSEFIESIQVSVEDLENQAQLGYVGGISKLFLENMKELGVNKRPIHCTDKKRNTLYIKENNEWEKEGSQEQLLYGIKVLTGRANQTLCDMKEDNPVEYSDIDSPFSTKCEDIQRNLLPVFPREATFMKVIDSISNGSIIEKEP
jgi:hypothetical protein